MQELDEVWALIAQQSQTIKTQADKIEGLTGQVGDRPAVAAELQNIAASIRGVAAGLDSVQPGVPTNPLPEPPAQT